MNRQRTFSYTYNFQFFIFKITRVPQKAPQGHTQDIQLLNFDDVVCESKLRLRIQAELAVHLQRTQRANFLVVERHIACGAHNAADGIDPLSKAGGRQ